jgi:YqaJ-like viral recombinase domain
MIRAFTIIDAPQRSPGWFAARLGRVTGSKASCVLMGEKTAGRADYVLQLALERLTGQCEESGYVNAEMQRGIDKEPLARMQAEAGGAFIRETGFLRHDTLMIGASLDGDEDDFKTIWEFKCPKSTTHVKYLKSAGADLVKDYQAQITHNTFLTSAERAIAGSFDDRLPPGLDWIQREVRAIDLPLEEYEKALMKFLNDVSNMTAELNLLKQGKL